MTDVMCFHRIAYFSSPSYAVPILPHLAATPAMNTMRLRIHVWFGPLSRGLRDAAKTKMAWAFVKIVLKAQQRLLPTSGRSPFNIPLAQTVRLLKALKTKS